MRTLIGPEMTSTVVVPRTAAFDRSGKRPMLAAADVGHRARKVCLYEWGGWWDDATLAGYTRADVRTHRRLYLNSGTIHTAVHFAWLAGARKILFIGCDGWHREYDQRIGVRSVPGCSYAKIRRVQDRELALLGLAAEYLNEPGLVKRLPRLAHFIWLGGRETAPRWAVANVKRFAALHPGWQVRVWTDLPADMPPDLYRIAADCEFVCSRKDVLSYWLLYRHGGIYIDCDVVALRSFEPLLRYPSAFAGVQHDGRINCAIMGSLPGRRAMADALARVRTIAADGLVGHHRAVFGPNLLSELFGAEAPAPVNRGGPACPASAGQGQDGPLAVLPEHYFYPLIDGRESAAYLAAEGDGARAQFLREWAERRQTDPTAPYCIHLWGVDGSGKARPFGRADALAYRIRQLWGEAPTVGAEIGVLAGRLTCRLLEMCPHTRVLMVDRWAAAPPDGAYARSGDTAAQLSDAQMAANLQTATERTAPYADRREILQGESAEIARQVPDSTLDWVFIDADHTAQGVMSDLEAWWPKVKPGGLVSGHDLDNPAAGVRFDGNPNWGVRVALEAFLRARKIDPDAAIEHGGEFTWFVQKPPLEPRQWPQELDLCPATAAGPENAPCAPEAPDPTQHTPQAEIARHGPATPQGDAP